MPDQACDNGRHRRRTMGGLQLQGNDADGFFPDPGYAEVDPTGRYGRFNEILGKGSSKTVYRGFDEWQGIEVAWNQVQLHAFLQSPGDLERLYCEIHLLKALRHRSIMRLHASWVDAPRRTVNFLTELFVSGTLRQYRETHRRVNMAAVKHWCRQILDGLAYLHGHDPPIIHRDLKCDNIFVNGNQGEVKIGDLGLAAVGRRSPRSGQGHCVGTPEFMAPEVYEESYDELADVYSFGMCVLEMVTLEYPYAECANPVQIYKKVISGIKPAAFYKVRDPAVRRFIGKCLVPASQRPAARELLHDPFLQVGDGGFCSGDGDYGVMYNYLHQPSCLDHHCGHSNGGSTASNGLSNSIEGDTPSEERSGCDDDDEDGDDDSRFHGIDLLFNEHDEDGDDIVEGGGGVDMRIKGVRTKDGGVFLRLLIADKDGTGLVRNIYFRFDTEADTALSVATEMVAELDITDHEVTRVAEMIDGEVGALVPGWTPGPGMNNEGDEGGAPDAPSAAYCRNCRPSSASSCGSLLDFMSSAARHGCRCAELHGRFEEITFQADDEDQVRFQDSGCSSDDGGSQAEPCAKDKSLTDMNGIAQSDTTEDSEQP